MVVRGGGKRRSCFFRRTGQIASSVWLDERLAQILSDDWGFWLMILRMKIANYIKVLADCRLRMALQDASKADRLGSVARCTARPRELLLVRRDNKVHGIYLVKHSTESRPSAPLPISAGREGSGSSSSGQAPRAPVEDKQHEAAPKTPKRVRRSRSWQS